jgi:hypothetical protein
MDPARDLTCRKTEITEALDYRRHIKGGMNRITGTGMIQRKFEQRLGRQAGTGPAKPDPRRSQIPEIAERST